MRELQKDIYLVSLVPEKIILPSDIRLSDSKTVKKAFLLAQQQSTIKEREEIIIIRGKKWTDEERTCQVVLEYARKAGLSIPTIETVFRFRMQVPAPQAIENILFMHEPIEGKWLVADHAYENEEGYIRRLSCFKAIPSGSYNGNGVGYAFVRPR
jgi:hypothetical protein